MNLKDILALGQGLVADLGNELNAILDNDGPEAATAVVNKLMKQNAAKYEAADVKVLAQDAFDEFRHLLRVGPADYPGAPNFPGIEAGADVVYAEGSCRSTIHTWCNAAAETALHPVTK